MITAITADFYRWIKIGQLIVVLDYVTLYLKCNMRRFFPEKATALAADLLNELVEVSIKNNNKKIWFFNLQWMNTYSDWIN